MKIARLAIGAVLIGSLTAGTALAQQWMTQSRNQSPPVQQTAAYDGYTYVSSQDQASASPSDVRVATRPVDSCYDGYSSAGVAPCGSGVDDDPWRLIGKTGSGIEFGGWISAGGYGNSDNAASNGPLGFNNVGDGFTANQLWFYAEKAADTGGYGWDWGGRVDYLFGVDGPDTQANRGLGWDTAWDTSRDYGSALPQLYGTIGYNDWLAKVGYFYTYIGYESVPAPDNFFYSHAYTQYYIEPFNHTGAVLEYNGYENWTFFGGWTLGWDTAFEQNNGASTFLGGVSYHPYDNLTVSYTTSAGRFENNNDIYMHSIVMELGLTDRLEWVIQSDLNTQEGARHNIVAGGVNQYLYYTFNDSWQLGLRFEWLYDRDGAFVLPGQAAGSYYNLTAGINWKPCENLTFRPEIRYDWFSGTFTPGGLPFDNGQDNEQFAGGFDVIFQF